MPSEPEPIPPPLPPPVRTDVRLKIEPDEQWKADLRKRIEHSLRNMVEDAQIVRDTILNSQPPESSRERALQDYENSMKAIRELAQEEFTRQLRLEMSERKWALNVIDPNPPDVAKQQQWIRDNTQKAQDGRISNVSEDPSRNTAGAFSSSPQQQGDGEGGSDESFEDGSEGFEDAGSDEGCASDGSWESEEEDEGDDEDADNSYGHPPRWDGSQPYVTGAAPHRPSSGSRAPSWRPHPHPSEPSGISRTLAHANGQIYTSPVQFPRLGSVNSTGSTSSGAGLRHAGSLNSSRYRSSSVVPPTPSGAELPPTHSRDRIATPLRPTIPDDVSRVASWGSRIHLGRSLSDFNKHPLHNSTDNPWLPPFDGDYSDESDGVVDDRQSRVIYDSQRLSEAMGQRTAIQRRPTTPDEVSRVALWGSGIHLGRSLSNFNTHRRHNNMGNSWMPPADGDYSDESDDVVGQLDDRQSLHSARSLRSVRRMRSVEFEQMFARREAEARRKEEEATRKEEGANQKEEEARPPISPASPDHSTTFNLKDLLTSASKLTRRSSARSSASSRKSDSEGGRKLTGGESMGSLLQTYERVAIGRGATSVVLLAHKWDRSKEKLFVVKEFRKRRKNESEKEYVKRLTAEFCISSTLHHINIVEAVDLVQDENQHWCEVIEFCPGGDLYAAIKKGHMSPSEIECCFRQILQGVAYLHSQGVAHRDLKPENVFFSGKGHLKIGDYGASTVYRLPWESTVHMSSDLCGSEPYIAPEQFLGKPYDARLADIWAVAIVFYCLHFQELPWRVAQASDVLYAAYVSACANPQQSATPPTINYLNPRACRSLIRRMLEPDPKQRAFIDECISHPWVQTIEVCHMVPNPLHIHVYAQSLAQTVIRG